MKTGLSLLLEVKKALLESGNDTIGIGYASLLHTN